MSKPKTKPKITASYERKPFTFLHLPMDFSPRYCSLAEACSYARHGLWQGHQKIKAGRWRAFKDGRRTIIEFASVIADEERLKAASAPPEKRPPGRPRKTKPEAAAASAE
jgi:hypothetical protein